MNREVLLQKLPPFSNRSVTIQKNQTVGDIVNEVLTAHEVFAPDYDAIAWEFDHGGNIETAKALFDFLKRYVKYKIESEAKQTTKSPAAIIETATGDCKHYSGFIAGVLDALKRQGRAVEWFYRFASYSIFDSLPGHVFVVINEGGKEYWIDPVLKHFNERLEPTYIVDKRPKKSLMLQRISGFDFSNIQFEPSIIRDPEVSVDDLYTIAMAEGDTDVTPEMTRAAAVLYKYGVMDEEGRLNDKVLEYLSETLPIDEFEEVANARLAMHTAAINGFFGDVWNGIKKVGLAIPRNAFLGLVRLNAFGFATKMHKAIYNSNGTIYEEGKQKLEKKWKSLGGSFSALNSAIKSAYKKKAILGQANAVGDPVVGTWVATASAIIAALKPLIEAILKQKQVEGIDNSYPYGVCADGFTPRNPDGTCTASQGQSGGVMDFIQNNPLLIAGGAVAAVYFFTQPKRRS